jgi:hypothetical protein
MFSYRQTICYYLYNAIRYRTGTGSRKLVRASNPGRDSAFRRGLIRRAPLLGTSISKAFWILSLPLATMENLRAAATLTRLRLNTGVEPLRSWSAL